MVLLFECLAALVVFGFFTVMTCGASEKNITKLEKLCRNPIIGVALSLPCALLCVPLAIPVSPGFLIKLLYPLAIILPIASYFYLDHYAARGMAFFMILMAYDVVHSGFELHIPGAPVVTVAALILGCIGIWIAAKPCTLRDIFRKSAASPVWKYSSAAVGVVGLLIGFYMLTVSIGVFGK